MLSFDNEFEALSLINNNNNSNNNNNNNNNNNSNFEGVRCSSVVRAFTDGALGRQIDPSWWTH